MRSKPLRSSLCILLTTVACISAGAQTACSLAAKAAASRVAEVQRQLSSIKLDEMDTNVPSLLQQSTTLLKQDLADAVQAILACEPAKAGSSALQNTLAQTLKANLPQSPRTTAPWGGNLRVAVDQTSTPPLLRVQLKYSIECGDDNMLLLFATEQDHWTEKLLWQSPAFKDDNGAFGDFFLTTFLAGLNPGDWRLVVAHGKPWCTSRFSGFSIDVLAPKSNDPHPQVLWHTDRGYSRADFTPTLKASDDSFELRLHEDEMSFDDNAFERTVIYRYRVSGTNVTRLEPIATNGRGFVEEWLSMPWTEARSQSLPTNADALHAIHLRYESSHPKGTNTYTSWTAGPVRSCSIPNHFQVNFDLQLNKFVPGKPGGEQNPPLPYYFQIKQISDGYRMESVSASPDPTCHGSNLMPAN